MGSTALQRLVSVEEYLAGEERAQVRHEYVAGRLFGMSGASRAHNTIAGNLFAAIGERLRGGPCRVFISDVKVRIRALDAFYYPDVVVACEPDDREAYWVEKPRLLIEVLSATTEAIDRREKLVAYQRIESLEEYVLVEQTRRAIEIYRRIGGEWTLESVDEGLVRLASVDLSIPIEAVYEGAAGV